MISLYVIKYDKIISTCSMLILLLICHLLPAPLAAEEVCSKALCLTQDYKDRHPVTAQLSLNMSWS